MIDNWLPLPRYTLRKDLVLRFLKKHDPETLSCIEIGYGSGDLMKSLASLGMNIHGYDFSDWAFRIANRKFRRCGSNLKKKIRLITDEKHILLSAYDAVLALEVLEHVRDDMTFLEKLNKILKPDGFLIFSVPAHMAEWGENDIWAGHYRRYEKKEIYDKLRATNFEPIHIWSYGYPLIRFLDMMIHRNRKGDIKDLKDVSKEDLTRNSGVSRDRNFINLLASWKIWVMPFFYIQQLFLEKDCTSAFLVFARKKII